MFGELGTARGRARDPDSNRGHHDFQGRVVGAGNDRKLPQIRTVFADLGRRARVEQPELRPLSDLVPRVRVVAITEIVAEEIRAGRTSKLTDLCDEVALLAIRLLADDATAERARAQSESS